MRNASLGSSGFHLVLAHAATLAAEARLEQSFANRVLELRWLGGTSLSAMQF